MTNELANVQATATITNGNLKKQLDKIGAELQTLSRVSLRICAIVSRIQSEELYADDYTDFENFGIAALGVKKSTLYNMAKVGRDWTDGKGHSVLWNGVAEDYSLTQIYEIMRIKTRKGSEETQQAVAKMLDEQGIISPMMKVSEIKETIKKYNDSINPKRIEEKSTEEGNDVETVATIVEDGQYDVQLTIKWLQLGSSYKLDVNGEIVDVSLDKWTELMNVVWETMKAQ